MQGPKKKGIIVLFLPASNPLSRFVFHPDNLLNRLRRNKLIRKIFNKPYLDVQRDEQFFMKLYKRKEITNYLKNAGFKILLEKPTSHSYSFYLLCECFQADSNGRTNGLAEITGAILKKILPWGTANQMLFLAEKI